MKYSLTSSCILLSSLLLSFQTLVLAQNALDTANSQMVLFQSQKPAAPTLGQSNSGPTLGRSNSAPAFGTPNYASFPPSGDQLLANLVRNRKTMSLSEFQSKVNGISKTGGGFTSEGINNALAGLHGKTNTAKLSKSLDRGIGKASFAEAILSNAPQNHQLDQRAVTALKKGTKWQNTKTVLKGLGTAGIALGVGTATGPVGAAFGLGVAGVSLWNAKRKFVPKSDKSKIDGLINSHGGQDYAKNTKPVSFPQKIKNGASFVTRKLGINKAYQKFNTFRGR